MARSARFLASRPRTESELRGFLKADGISDVEIDETLRWARERRYVDDGAFAERWIEGRASRKGIGRTRLLDELVQRGVERRVAAAAWERAVGDGSVDPSAILRRAVERKVAAARRPLDGRGYARVYNALLRAGFDAAAVREALAPHRPRKGDEGDETPERTDHDLP